MESQYTGYHCLSPKVLNYSKIDTSICAVFYVRNEAELNSSFLPRLKEYIKIENSLLQLYPITPPESAPEEEDIIMLSTFNRGK